MIQHSGNQANQIQFEEHDGENNAKRVTLANSNATIYAVVNTGGGAANVTLNPSPNFIGIVTVANPGAAAAGNVTLDPGSVTGLGAGVAFIGHATVRIATNVNTNIGLVTVDGGRIGLLGNNTVVLGAGVAGIGFATIAIGANVNTNIGLVTVAGGSLGITGNVTLSDAKTFIGLTTTTLGASPAFIGIVTVTNPNGSIIGNVTLSDAKTYIGLTTTTLGVGDRFIGLVTAVTRNAGTTKTLVQLPVGLGNNSLVSITPTNANKINVTQLILNSNITTSLAIKSGATYMTGNASLAITVYPGGGFVMSGSPDSPAWIGLPSGAFIVEKRDSGGTVANLTGHVIYFDE